jgi:crossover junction endodeoxyribonuclease RusA
MSANEQRRAHFHQQAKAKREVGDVVSWMAKRQGIQDLKPSIVTVTWFAPDRRKRDTDGLGPFLKAVLDGLKSVGVWPDDHSDWVIETRLRIDKADTSNPRIEILIEEITDDIQS